MDHRGFIQDFDFTQRWKHLKRIIEKEDWMLMNIRILTQPYHWKELKRIEDILKTLLLIL